MKTALGTWLASKPLRARTGGNVTSRNIKLEQGKLSICSFQTRIHSQFQPSHFIPSLQGGTSSNPGPPLYSGFIDLLGVTVGVMNEDNQGDNQYVNSMCIYIYFFYILCIQMYIVYIQIYYQPFNWKCAQLSPGVQTHDS